MGVETNPPSKKTGEAATPKEPATEAKLQQPTTTEVQQNPGKEDDDVTLLGSSTLPAAISVGANEVNLGYLVREAKKDSGYSAAKWNELSDETRDEHLNKKLEELRAAAEKKSSTKGDEADTTAESEDVHVHDGRAIGGSYVALGGGERRRVGERSGGPVPAEDAPVEE